MIPFRQYIKYKAHEINDKTTNTLRKKNYKLHATDLTDSHLLPSMESQRENTRQTNRQADRNRNRQNDK